MAIMVTKTSPVSPDTWPKLPYTEWADTLATLHRWGSDHENWFGDEQIHRRH